MSLPPSIFNDVLGPVMRGPSSSHSAAANRIGRIARNLFGEPIRKLIANYDPNGSLITTHKDQGADLGLYSGILGWERHDALLPTCPQALEEAGVEVVVAMNKVAHQIPRELRCTNLGGLSITPTADKIAASLAAKSCDCQSSCKG